jgi:hypothetical protein
MEIPRELYLSRLKHREGNHLIKVVTGVRRCGKSYLLFKLFKKHLLSKGVPADHIIEIEFDRLRNVHLRKAEAVCKYIDARLKDGGMHYLLLDEVQFLENFEAVLNDYLHLDNVDIYVTGSNSRFLTTDVLTEFRGRGDEVHVFPLSFSEYLQGRGGTPERAWRDYLLYGGLPLTLSMESDEEKSSYLKSLFEETYIADITQRHRMKKHLEELRELLQVVASSVGSLTSAQRLSDTFRSESRVGISRITLGRYCRYFAEAFLVSKARRYDVKGRKYINGLNKFYFEDVGLRNALLNFRQFEETHLMENVIYNELRIRGYNVDVGVVDLRHAETDHQKVEIDFVANLGSRRYYVQSAFAIPDEEKRAKEIRPFRNVGDSFKKIVVTGNNTPVWRDENGILTINVLDFLLNPDSLEQ